MEKAYTEGFRKNPDLVHELYNLRRQQLLSVEPNKAHYFLAELEKDFHVDIVTQNVDDLHERAGSSHVLHLHGELLKIQSLQDPKIVKSWTKDITIDYNDVKGNNYRHFIVWIKVAIQLQETMLCRVDRFN